MNIIELDWDSQFIGIKTGRTIVSNEIDFDPKLFMEMAKNESFDLVYIFVDSKMLSQQKLKSANLELMDIHLTMKKSFNKSDFIDSYYDFRTDLSPKELSECYTIAEQTSVVSRFYKEPLVGPQKTKAMYRLWIDNALNSTFSDGLFIVKDNDTVQGIHLIKTDPSTGYFTLTGVNTNLKGAGLGSRLWNQSFAYWAQETDISVIHSPFSFQNIESFNFHLKHNFRKVLNIKYIYHYRSTSI